MAQVVYTNIEKIEDLRSAVWKTGIQDSYDETKKLADGGRGVTSLIARQSKDGGIRLAYAKTGSSPWFVVGEWHLAIAMFFVNKIKSAPSGQYLRPFFDSIDDQKAAHAAQQLIGIEVGINKEYGPDNGTHAAILGLCDAVSALARIPNGDWMFVPVRKSVYGV